MWEEVGWGRKLAGVPERGHALVKRLLFCWACKGVTMLSCGSPDLPLNVVWLELKYGLPGVEKVTLLWCTTIL